MKLGKNVRIWRDDKLQGNDRFAEEIVDQFNSTAALISVLSPRYVQSEWCTREVDEFCKRAQNKIFVENKARIFKVVRTPVDCENTLPSIMQELLGYDFFIFEDGSPMTFDEMYGEQYGVYFNKKVSALAYEIADLLKKLEVSADEPVAQPSTPVSDKTTVYLADCAYDMKETRDAIETQLSCMGYQVLPEKRRLPMDAEAYTEAVDEILERCQLSVHLIGEQYGSVPDGPNDESTARIQNRLAAQMSRTGNLSRIIWLGSDSVSNDEKQQRFIDELHEDADAQYGADLLTGDVESLKSAIGNQLAQVKKRSSSSTTIPANTDASDTQPAVNAPDEHIGLYLICTEQDQKAILPLINYFGKHKIRVSIPEFKGDAARVRWANQQLLTNSEIIVVFYGEGEEAWKQSIDTDLKKLPAYLEGRPAPAIYTYLTEPHSFDKDDLIELDRADIIDCLDGMNETTLDEVFARSATVLSTS